MIRSARLGIGVILLCGIVSPASASETIAYNYDALGRVTSVSRSGAVNNGTFEGYSYDSAGNRSNVTVGTSASAPAFSIADTSVTEGGVLTFTVTRWGSTGSAVGATYATSNGTATAGSDYTASSGTLSFAPGETAKIIAIATIDETIVEGSETVLVTLTSPTGGASINDGQATGTIIDND